MSNITEISRETFLREHLIRKDEVDSLEIIKQNPEVLPSGLASDSGERITDKMRPAKTILHDSPNLCKQIGDSMKNQGFFKFPRYIFDDPRFKSAPMKYQKVLLIILENIVYKSTDFSVGVHIIKVNPGQISISHERIVELCNQGVKFEEDLIDVNISKRSIKYFCQCHFMTQEVIHRRSLLTVLNSDDSDKNKSLSEPTSERRVNHDRTINRELEELEEVKELTVCNREKIADSKIKILEKLKQIPQKIVKQTFDGDVEVKLDDIIALSLRENPEFVILEIQEAWEILVNYKGVIRLPYDFIAGTIKNIRNQKRAEHNQKQRNKNKEKDRCQPKHLNKQLDEQSLLRLVEETRKRPSLLADSYIAMMREQGRKIPGIDK